MEFVIKHKPTKAFFKKMNVVSVTAGRFFTVRVPAWTISVEKAKRYKTKAGATGAVKRMFGENYRSYKVIEVS